MINIYQYFEVDWNATTTNLKYLLLSKTSYNVLADALHVDSKTVSNWLNNKTKPDISTLSIFARFLDMDLLDIIIYKGQQTPMSDDETKTAMQDSQIACDNLPEKKSTGAKDTSCAEGFVSTVLFNEYYSQHAHIQSLEEFLLYLPLFDFKILADVFHRLQGNLKSNHKYVLKQLNRLYDHIPNSFAKDYADSYQYYHLMTPTVLELGMRSDVCDVKPEKHARYCEWIASASIEKELTAYEKACEKFVNRLIFSERIKYLLEEVIWNDSL